jgi:hypothetical protein
VQGMRSALGELLAPAGLVETNFLALNFTSVTSDETCFRKRRFERQVVGNQCPRDTMPDRASLAGLAATGDIDQNVKACQSARSVAVAAERSCAP